MRRPRRTSQHDIAAEVEVTATTTTTPHEVQRRWREDAVARCDADAAR
jgi:hypothetical protein